ncbi:MAG: hypothetical protein KDD01_26890, partial [Phaeodactylibacter sp.]|nr:hypothetical protein [Phaeodactylibacter sp.]
PGCTWPPWPMHSSTWLHLAAGGNLPVGHLANAQEFFSYKNSGQSGQSGQNGYNQHIYSGLPLPAHRAIFARFARSTAQGQGLCTLQRARAGKMAFCKTLVYSTLKK